MLQLPEFCVDRNLGKTVPARLSALGWTMHLIAEEFPNDAQAISDAEWIDYGLNKRWVLLCKDSRIRGRDHDREAADFADPVLGVGRTRSTSLAAYVTWRAGANAVA